MILLIQVSLMEKIPLLFTPLVLLFYNRLILLLWNQEALLLTLLIKIIKEIRIYITDGKRRIVNLNGADVSFSLLLKPI